MMTSRRPCGPIVKLVQKGGLWLGHQCFYNPMDEGSEVEQFLLIGQPDWKVALAITEDDMVLVRRQWKAGRDGDGEELPASSIEYEGMSDEEVVRHELREGAGYEVPDTGVISCLGHVFMASRNSPTRAQCWLITNCRQTPTNTPNAPKRRRVNIHLVPLRVWVEKVMKGEIDEQSSVVTTFRALPHLGIKLDYPTE